MKSVDAANDQADDDARSDRLASLERYEILDSEPEAVFDEIVGIAAQLCRAPIALR